MGEPEIRCGVNAPGGSALVFEVPGEPVPKQMGALIRGRVTKSTRVRSWEDTVRVYSAREVMRVGWRPDPEARYSVSLCFYIADHRIVDCDNLAKSTLDGLKRIRGGYGWFVFHDDSQVDHLEIRKCVDRSRPRVAVEIRVIT